MIRMREALVLEVHRSSREGLENWVAAAWNVRA